MASSSGDDVLGKVFMGTVFEMHQHMTQEDHLSGT